MKSIYSRNSNDQDKIDKRAKKFQSRIIELRRSSKEKTELFDRKLKKILLRNAFIALQFFQWDENQDKLNKDQLTKRNLILIYYIFSQLDEALLHIVDGSKHNNVQINNDQNFFPSICRGKIFDVFERFSSTVSGDFFHWLSAGYYLSLTTELIEKFLSKEKAEKYERTVIFHLTNEEPETFTIIDYGQKHIDFIEYLRINDCDYLISVFENSYELINQEVMKMSEMKKNELIKRVIISRSLTNITFFNLFPQANEIHSIVKLALQLKDEEISEIIQFCLTRNRGKLTTCEVIVSGMRLYIDVGTYIENFKEFYYEYKAGYRPIKPESVLLKN